MRIHKLFAMLALAAATTMTVSCGSENDNSLPVIKLQGITISAPEITDGIATLAKGGTIQLTITLSPADTEQTAVFYISSDSNVATVDANGLVEAIGSGTATITVYSNDNPGVSQSFTINVADDILDIDPSDVSQGGADARRR